MSVLATAQKEGDRAIGANWAFFGTQTGIGAKYQYNLTKPFRVESSFYYMFNNYLSKWDVYFNGHLLIPISGRMKIYPLAGLGIVRHEDRNVIYDEENDNYIDSGITAAIEWGRNMGIGIEFKVNEIFIINAEFNHKSLGQRRNSDYLSIGLIYRLK